MKEHYCSYSQAVKLKEFGFDESCEYYYNPYQELRISKDCLLSPKITNNRFLEEIADGMATAPRLDQAAAWLREVKEIDVLVFNCSCGYGWEISKANPESRGTGIAIFDGEGEDENSGMWLSYEKALSAGIDKAISLLREKE